MSEAISERQVQELLRGIHIPAQPQILADLQLAHMIEQADISDIAALITKDISLSGGILKIVNSPFYASSHRITSIEQAILLLGMETVINVVNSIALKSELSSTRNLKEDDVLYLNRFWDCTQDVAVVCAIISRQIGLANADDAYNLGLFHNAGIPLLLQHIADYQKVLMQAYGCNDAAGMRQEDQLINTSHAVIGYYIGKSWRLADNICEAILLHHRVPEVYADHRQHGGDVINLLSILKLAEHIVGLYRHLGKHDIDLEWQSFGEIVLNYLSLSDDEVADIMTICGDLGISCDDYRV